MSTKKTQTVRVRLRRLFFAGIATLVPAALAVYILLSVFRLMDGLFAPILVRAIDPFLPGVYIPGLGLILTLLLIFVLGWLSTNMLGRRLLAATEQLIARVPIASTVYSATKGVLEALSVDQADAFQRVVLIEYPRKGLYAVAFVTGKARWGALTDELRDSLLVFLPTSPNPTSGFLLLVPRVETVEMDISVEEGIRMVISGGILMPPAPQAKAESSQRTGSTPTQEREFPASIAEPGDRVV